MILMAKCAHNLSDLILEVVAEFPEPDTIHKVSIECRRCGHTEERI